MLNWKRDIRRNLPEYQTREGDVVYNAPYRATQADLNAFALRADPKALKSLLDAELNDCVSGEALVGSQRGLRFLSAEPFIVLIYAAFRSFSSTDETDRRLGRAQAFELSIWVPIVKEQFVSGIVTSEPAWFLPLVYTSPTASVATGREVFGYPKIPAYLEIPDEGGAPVAVQLREEFEDERVARRKKPSRLFTVPKQQTPDQSGWNIDLSRKPQLAAIINRYLANHPIIFRKQVGMLENAARGGLVAGYTALIESRVPITRISSLNPLDETRAFSSNVGGLDQELAGRLGLEDLVPQFGIGLHDCRLDIQHGREIWVASEQQKFIKPLPAPGNTLIWTPHPFTAKGRAMAKGSRQAAHDAPDTGADSVEGVAEAYFGRTRRFAIQSLLDRHFPDHLSWRPTADPDRDFVMFLFVRASAAAKVHLYELSVWVPVKHQDVAVWYSPYVFRSPGAAVIQARQRFGHPCQEGYIEFEDDAPTRTVFVRIPTSLGRRGVDWLRRDGIKFEASQDAPDPAHFSEKIAREALASNIEQNVVGLLQFRHAADTTRACLQKIVRSRRLINADDPRPIGDWKATLPGELRFGRLLDLNGNSQMVQGYRFDKITIETSPWTVYGEK